MAGRFKVLSLNIGSSTTLAGLLSIISLDKPQLVMLQEVTLTSEQLNVQVAKFGYKAVTNTDMNNPTALGTGFVWQTHLPVSGVYSVIECRGQSLQLGPYNFINVYAPSGSQNKNLRREFFGQELFRHMRGLSNLSYQVLGGDFNCILSPKDTENNFGDKKCPALKDLIENFNFSDTYRLLHPNGGDFSFYRPNCAASRLDRFYVPQNLVGNVISVSYQASLGDHKGVCMEMSLPDLMEIPAPPLSSSPYWKLNTAILKDEDFLENFKNRTKL